jgi:hypothetical protein
MFKITFTLKISYIMIIKCTIWEYITIFYVFINSKTKKKFYISSTYNLLGKSQISLQVDAFKKDLLECILKMCFVNLY